MRGETVRFRHICTRWGVWGGLLKPLCPSERPSTHITSSNCLADFHEFIWKNFINNCLSISGVSDVMSHKGPHCMIHGLLYMRVGNTLLKTNR